MMMATAFDFALEGNLTDGGPQDPRLYAALYSTGWRPYSIKVGNTYFSYQGTEPLATTLGYAAGLAE